MPGGKQPSDISPLQDPEGFRGALASWFQSEGRDYPWRRTRDPYAVLVSEVMLQQTQVATVLGRGYYTRWIERFPDVHTLAEAPEQEVLRAWEGLGYYSRARNLHQAARAVVERHDGHFPRDSEAIRALPGVGRYTAGAVSSFAFDDSAPLVDANVARVLARLFDLREPIDAARGRSQLWHWAEALVPDTGARGHNSALMELGQQICLPRRPHCAACPVSAWCRTDAPGTLPLKQGRKAAIETVEHAIFLVEEEGGSRVLLEQEHGRRRQGLWKLPARDETEVQGLPHLLDLRYGIMHYRVTLRVHGSAPGSGPGSSGREDVLLPRPPERWHATETLAEVPMPSPYRRALDSLLAARDALRLGS